MEEEGGDGGCHGLGLGLALTMVTGQYKYIGSMALLSDNSQT